MKYQWEPKVKGEISSCLFLSFHVSRRANRQVRHQPHFHFKTNSPTSRGGAVCPLLHFMAPEFILRGRGSGGRMGILPILLQSFFSRLSTLLSSTYHIIFRCGRANSGACSSHAAWLTHGAEMIGGLSLLFTSKVVPPNT